MNEQEPDYMTFFFKKYIQYTLDQLSEEENTNFNSLKLYNVYKRKPEDWTETISAVLNLSSTINIAIWDLWIKNSKIAEQENLEYTADQFADGFIENYFLEDSKVDVWEGTQLEEAKKLIEEFRS